MASVTWQGFSSFVQSAVAAVQAAANAIIDATVGSVTLAYAQAQSAAALFLQGQAAQVTALTRLGTSSGGDVDSFVNTFGMERDGATYATTSVTVARFTDTQSAFIQAGTGSNATLAGGQIVSTGPGGVQFMVTADATNSYWSASQGGYLIPSGTPSADIPVQCLTAGIAGNVLANTITSFFSPIPGIDTVTNAAAVTNGMAQESDPAVKTRFPIYFAGLASADIAAIVSATISAQQGLIYIPIENYDYPGTTADDGNFFIIVDDGSHNPPSSLLTAVYNAVYPVRGFTVRFQGTYGPTATPISINGSITSGPGYVHGSVVEAVEAAWGNWIEGIYAAWAAPIMAALLAGEPITISPPVITIAEAAAVALSVPGCTNVNTDTLLINSANADLTLTIIQAPEPGTISAS